MLLCEATLDPEAYDLCMTHHGLCVRGRVSVLKPGLLNKMTG